MKFWKLIYDEAKRKNSTTQMYSLQRQCDGQQQDRYIKGTNRDLEAPMNMPLTVSMAPA
jgi:hypothetical protein